MLDCKKIKILIRNYPSRLVGMILAVKGLGFINIIWSLYINLRLFPFPIALRLPVLASRKTKFFTFRRNSIIFTSSIRPGMLKFGLSHKGVYYNAPLFIRIEGKLIIHGRGNHDFASGCALSIRNTGILEIGDNFTVANFSKWLISCHSSIGENNLHSWHNFYYDTDGHPIYDENGNIINKPRPFRIGDNVWVGARCSILKGAVIPDGCIIASQSVVNSKLEIPNAIYAGRKIIKENISWKGIQG